jgi:hypothetical protein
MDLSDRALNVLATLELDLGKKPIVFITHSLGGLIVKKVLQLASGPGTGPKRKAIAEETKGICFIATPHNGSSLANAARILPTLYRPSKATLSLIAHDSSLRDLNDWYRDFATSLAIKTLAFAETSAYWSLIWLKGKVVDQDSANPGLPGERAIPVDGHHLTVHVPTSRQRPLYRQVVAFLEECVANPPSPRLPMRRAAGQSANPTTCPSSASAPSSRAAMAS